MTKSGTGIQRSGSLVSEYLYVRKHYLNVTFQLPVTFCISFYFTLIKRPQKSCFSFRCRFAGTLENILSYEQIHNVYQVRYTMFNVYCAHTHAFILIITLRFGRGFNIIHVVTIWFVHIIALYRCYLLWLKVMAIVFCWNFLHFIFNH